MEWWEGFGYGWMFGMLNGAFIALAIRNMEAHSR